MKLLIISIFLISINCKPQFFKNYKRPSYEFQSNKKDLLIDGKYISTNVNGTPLLLIFDTGARTFFFNNKVKFEESDYLGAAKSKSADNKTIEIKSFNVKSLSTSTTKTANRIIYTKQTKFTPDCITQKTDGLLGPETYYDSKLPFLLNYEDNTISILDKIPSEYVMVDSDFSGLTHLVYINILVNGKKYKCLFDSGALDTAIAIKSSSFNKEGRIISSLSATTNGISVLESSLVEKNNVSVGIFNTVSYISYNPGLSNNILGLSFMRNYNWILDYKNKKMYAKQISTKPITSILSERKSGVANVEGKLLIALTVRTPDLKYNTGQQIISVNGTQITPENICQYQKLLNDTENWDTLNLVVK